MHSLRPLNPESPRAESIRPVSVTQVESLDDTYLNDTYLDDAYCHLDHLGMLFHETQATQFLTQHTNAPFAGRTAASMMLPSDNTASRRQHALPGSMLMHNHF